MRQLTTDITEQQHRNLKALAALQGKTIKQYAVARLLPGNLDADQVWQEFSDLLGSRVREGLAGKISSKSIGTILHEGLDEKRA